MQKNGLRRYINNVFLVALLALGGTGAVHAVTSVSPNYQMTESQFNSGTLEGCSGEYCARASIGDMTDGGQSESPSYTASFGAVTDSEPLLEIIVDVGESNLGILTTEQTATKTSVVRVRSYLSGGYVLQMVGDPPKYGNHTLSALASPTASAAGSEQFGINATDNSSPDVGASLAQVPSEQLSFGEVDEDYRTANLFKYVSGDVIGRSLTESGRTDYTISMIVNISNSTPAGRYTGDYAAVVVPVY